MTIKYIIYLVLLVVAYLINKEALYKYFFLLLAFVPNNKFIRDLVGLNSYIFNTNLDITITTLTLLFLMSIFELLKRRNEYKIDILDITVQVLAFTIIIYYLIGRSNGNPYTSIELFIYFKIFLIYFSYKIYLSFNNKFEEYITALLKGSIIYSFVVIIISFFKAELLPLIYSSVTVQWWQNRIAFGNTSTLLITLFIALYNKKISKRLKILVVVSNLYAIVLSQNITIAVFVIANAAIYLLYFIVKSEFTKGNTIKMAILSVAVLVLTSSIFYLVYNDNYKKTYIYERTFGTTLNNNVNTLDIRNLNNSSILNQFKNNDFKGIGLGKELQLIDESYYVIGSSLYTDNLIITLVYKIGIFGVSILVLYIIFVGINIIKKTKSLFIFPALYISFIVLTCAMTAQLIYSDPVNIFYLVISMLYICNFEEKGIAV